VGEGGDLMLKKKQVLTIMSVAVVSILLGTAFNFTTVVTGDGGSPWDNVWTAISELQSEVDSFEARMPQVITADISRNHGIIVDSNWHDLLSITVTLYGNASVLAVGTTLNLTAGTYTFAFQYVAWGSGSGTLRDSRLTLMIIY